MLRLFKVHEVLWIGLRVMVSDKHAGVRRIVNRGIVQLMARSHVWCDRVRFAVAVVTDDNFTKEHTLHARSVWRTVGRGSAVGGIDGKVHAFPEARSISATEGTIESLLNDFRHDVRCCAMEKPSTLQARCACLVTFALQHSLSFHGEGLPQGHVLDSLHFDYADLRRIQCAHEGFAHSGKLGARLQREELGRLWIPYRLPRLWRLQQFSARTLR